MLESGDVITEICDDVRYYYVVLGKNVVLLPSGKVFKDDNVDYEIKERFVGKVLTVVGSL